jgi:hypothetical protein
VDAAGRSSTGERRLALAGTVAPDLESRLTGIAKRAEQ